MSRKNITGLIRLELRFEPADDADATAGTIHVTIKEGRDLGTKEPYIKMYLSKVLIFTHAIVKLTCIHTIGRQGHQVHETENQDST